MNNKIKAAGRPRKKPPITDFLDEILDDVVNGGSMKKACNSRGYTTQDFWNAADKDKTGEILGRYARAKEERGDSCLDKIEAYQQDLIAKKIDAQTARVLIDTEKWKAGKFYPNMYGDAVQNNTITNINVLPDITISGEKLTFNIGDEV